MLKEYTESELRLILSMPPTRASAAALAPVLGRTQGAIELVYRHVGTPTRENARGYMVKAKAIARELGWVINPK